MSILMLYQPLLSSPNVNIVAVVIIPDKEGNALSVFQHQGYSS